MFDTSLALIDFFWIAVIVMIFGGTSGIVTSNTSATMKKIETLEKKLDELLATRKEQARQ